MKGDNPMKMKTKMTFLAIVFMLIQAPFAIADNIVINNNPAPPQSNEAPPPPPPPAQQGGGCPPANQNNIYDPRVPPAGVYHTSNADTYTTGEKKPYIVDNNCNNNSAQPTPQVYVQPNMPMH